MPRRSRKEGYLERRAPAIDAEYAVVVSFREVDCTLTDDLDACIRDHDVKAAKVLHGHPERVGSLSTTMLPKKRNTPMRNLMSCSRASTMRVAHNDST
jgi:hypothetical protein